MFIRKTNGMLLVAAQRTLIKDGARRHASLTNRAVFLILYAVCFFTVDFSLPHAVIGSRLTQCLGVQVSFQ